MNDEHPPPQDHAITTHLQTIILRMATSTIGPIEIPRMKGNVSTDAFTLRLCLIRLPILLLTYSACLSSHIHLSSRQQISRSNHYMLAMNCPLNDFISRLYYPINRVLTSDSRMKLFHRHLFSAENITDSHQVQVHPCAAVVAVWTLRSMGALVE